MTQQDEQLLLEVSGRLKKIIQDLGYTQSEFAEQLGYGTAYINHMSNGIKPMSGSFIYDFSKRFGSQYNLNWLMTGSGEMLFSENNVDRVSNAKELSLQELAEKVKDIDIRVSRLENYTEYKS